MYDMMVVLSYIQQLCARTEKTVQPPSQHVRFKDSTFKRTAAAEEEEEDGDGGDSGENFSSPFSFFWSTLLSDHQFTCLHLLSPLAEFLLRLYSLIFK